MMMPPRTSPLHSALLEYYQPNELLPFSLLYYSTYTTQSHKATYKDSRLEADPLLAITDDEVGSVLILDISSS